MCKIFIRTAGGLGAVSKMPFDGQDISVVKKGEAAIKCLLVVILVVVDSKSFIGACIYQSWSVMPQSVENNVRGF